MSADLKVRPVIQCQKCQKEKCAKCGGPQAKNIQTAKGFIVCQACSKKYKHSSCCTCGKNTSTYEAKLCDKCSKGRKRMQCCLCGYEGNEAAQPW